MTSITPDTVLRLAHEGESLHVEFKRTLPPQDNLAATLAAFANTEGGVVLVGLGDDGEVIGLPEESVGPTVDRLVRVSRSLMPHGIDVGVVEVASRKVVYANVGRVEPSLRPITTSRGEAFTREGAHTRRLRPETYERLVARNSHPASVRLFVAMSFREEEEPALVDYWRAIERAAKASALPFDLRRVDLIEGDYEISQKIMDEIDVAQVVLVDFTLSPHNVYFELGFARGKAKRVIQTARKGTSLQFDVRNWRTTFYRNATELEEKLLPELRAAHAEVQDAG